MRISKLTRIPLALAASVVLTFGLAFLYDALPPPVMNHIPSPILYALNLPGAAYCYYLKSTEPRPDDDIPLFEAGQDAQCYFVGLALNIPYFALWVLMAWWAIDKWRAKHAPTSQPA
jgi:hypothetical protein